MRELELCVSATLLCVEQDRRVLFLTEQEISRTAGVRTIRLSDCTSEVATKQHVFTSRKEKWCKIRMFNRDE